MTMVEIQEAAKIITENIDEYAKIIFGAFHDARLKKNELKVTVVASGFPKDMPLKNQNLFQTNPFAAATKNKIKEKEQQIPVNTPPITTEEEKSKEWEAIPAFLRRSKKDE